MSPDRPATAGSVSLVRGTWCIIAYQAYAACLRGRLNSNVRHHEPNPRRRSDSSSGASLVIRPLLSPNPGCASPPRIHPRAASASHTSIVHPPRLRSPPLDIPGQLARHLGTVSTRPAAARSEPRDA
jgi:hypothetical protein